MEPTKKSHMKSHQMSFIIQNHVRFETETASVEAVCWRDVHAGDATLSSHRKHNAAGNRPQV